MYDVAYQHATAVAASVTSAVTTTGLALGAIPAAVPPDGVPWFVPWLMTMAGPALMFLLGRILAAFAASRRARANAKRRKAQALLKDKDAANDALVPALEEDADALEASASALDALRPPDSHKPQ